MKKKIIIFLVGFCLITTVAAAVAGSINWTDIEPAEQEGGLYTTYDKAPQFQTQLSNQEDNAIFTKLDRSGKDKNTIYQDISAYKKLKKLYRPSEQELEYLDGLIETGADVLTVMELYCFWLTTSEDISIIGQMYSASGQDKQDYWMEELFNKFTETRHGVLDENGVNVYLVKGLTASDINIANVLSRRGVLTIQEILDRRVAGDSWNILIEQIGLQKEQPAHAAYMGEIGMDIEFMKYLNFVNTVPAEAIPEYAAALSAELGRAATIDDLIFANEDRVRKEVHTELLADGVFLRDGQKENQNNTEVLKEKIRENGVEDTYIEAFLEEGYTLLEILNASEAQKSGTDTAAQVLQEQRADQLAEMEVIGE